MISITEKVNKEVKTPSSGLILHGILMSYKKNVQIDNIAKLTKNKKFSKIAERVMKFMITIHCSLHKITYRERQKIQSKFKIPTRKLLHKNDTKKENEENT